LKSFGPGLWIGDFFEIIDYSTHVETGLIATSAILDGLNVGTVSGIEIGNAEIANIVGEAIGDGKITGNSKCLSS
jgi:hypothetical protein